MTKRLKQHRRWGATAPRVEGLGKKDLQQKKVGIMHCAVCGGRKKQRVIRERKTHPWELNVGKKLSWYRGDILRGENTGGSPGWGGKNRKDEWWLEVES